MSEEPGVDTLRVPVLRVFDGDGFLTRIIVPRRGEVEAAVRFGFIDAPELGQTGGYEARDFLTKLIDRRWLDLVVLLKMDTGQIVDGHGRIVAVPYLREDNGDADGLTVDIGRDFHDPATIRALSMAAYCGSWG